MTSAYIASVYITGDSAEFDSTIEGVSSAGDAAASSIAAAFDALGVQLDAAFSETGAKIDAAFAEMAGGATVASGEMSATMAAAGEEASGALAENLGDAGILAGTALHDGVTEGTEGLADDVGTAGEEAGTALKEGVTASTGEMAEELAGAGVLAGTGLHEGVTEGTEGLEDDLGTVGKDSGAALTEGAGEGLTGIKGMLSNLGVPEGLLGGWGELAAGVGGVTAAGIDLAEKMQSADTAIATSAGISTTAAHQIGTAFLKMSGEFDGKEFATAFALVAGQLKSLQGSALTTAQSVQFMTAAATLATAKQIGLKTATGTLASVMQAYGLKVKTAATASDVLFEASNATGQSVTSVGSAVDKVKTKLGGLAPTLGQLSGLLVDMTDHGETGRASMTALTTGFTAFLAPAAAAAKANDDLNVAMKNLTPQLASFAKQVQAGTLAGTALNTITTTMTAKQQALWATFTSANKAVATAAQAMQKMGITVETATGKMRPLGTLIGQLHTQITGMTKAQAVAKLEADGLGSAAAKLEPVIAAGTDTYNAATASVTKMGTAHAGAAKESATLSVEFETIKATADDWLTEIGQVAIPILGDLVGGLAKVASSIGSVVGWFKKASDPALAVAAAIGVVLLPKIISLGTEAVTSFGEMAASAAEWFAGMLGDIAAAGIQFAQYVSGFVAKTVAYITGNESMTASMTEFAAQNQAASEDVATAAQEMAAQVGESVASMPAYTGPAIDDIQAQLGALGPATQDTSALFTLSASDMEDALGAIGAAAEETQATVTEAMEGTGAAMEAAAPEVEGASEAMGDAVDTAFGPLGIIIGAVALAGTLLATHWQDVEKILSDVWNGIKDVALDVWDEIKDHLSEIIQGIVIAVTGPIGVLADLVYHYWDQISAGVTTAWDAIKSFLSSAWSAIKTVFEDASIVGLIMSHWTQIKTDATTAWDDVLAFLKGIPKDIEDIFSDAGTWLVDVGKDILKGLGDGIKDGVDAVLNIVKGVGSDISSGFKTALSIFSPSKVFYSHGQAIMQGVASGITDTAKLATDAIAKVGRSIATTAFTPPAIGPLAASGGSSGALVSALSGGGTVAGAGAAPGPAGATIVINQTNNTNASAHDIGTETGWALRTHTGS